jgi:hypothetical protein
MRLVGIAFIIGVGGPNVEEFLAVSFTLLIFAVARDENRQD